VAQSRSELAPAERRGDIIDAELEESTASDEVSDA
jgi:hypothetical protein